MGVSYGIIARKTWRRQNFRSLSDRQKLLALYIWTCPAGEGGAGLIFVPAPMIAHDLKWSEKETVAVIQELEKIGFLECDHEAGVILLPRQLDFSPPCASNNVKGLIARLDHVPDSQLIYRYCQLLSTYVDAVQLTDWAITESARYAEWYSIKDTLPKQPEPKHKKKPKPKEQPESKETDATTLTANIAGTIRNMFHETCRSMPRIQAIVGERLKHLQARWSEHPDIEWWQEYFTRINRSPFLNGRTLKQRGIRPRWCDFDWLINATNMNKILEGKYERQDDSDTGNNSQNHSGGAVHVDTSKYDRKSKPD